MFTVVVLLACSAAIASSAGPNASTTKATSSANQKEPGGQVHALLNNLFHPFPRTRKVPASTEIANDHRTQQHAEIFAIFDKLYQPFHPSCKVPASATPTEISLIALRFAHYYAKALKVGHPGLDEETSIVPYPTYSPLWDPESFKQRVKNFDWVKLLAPQQYHAMARVLVRLLELVERAYKDELEVVATEYKMPTHTEVKSKLDQDAKLLSIRYDFPDVPQPVLQQTTLYSAAAASLLAQLDDVFDPSRESLPDAVTNLFDRFREELLGLVKSHTHDARASPPSS
jgi:hypothetical protein